ncbi:MAG: alpha/beta hydrolase, partial [Candidatus Cloacimonetes bacterium]|nr:alpha/beta hydrolase [Candidatus Cloacimonadota bacterium]
YYFKDLDAYPSNKYLQQCEKPILILQGAKDFQVSYVKDFGKYQTLLKNKDNVTFKLYENLNHMLITSTTQTGDEYYIKDTVNAEALEDITDWIKKN